MRRPGTSVYVKSVSRVRIPLSPPNLLSNLSHTDKNQVRSTYNKAVRLQERREMMQKWSDYIDQLRFESTE